MRLKKMFAAVMSAALVSVLFAMPVSAHGHQGHHGYSSSASSSSSSSASVEDTGYPVCTVEGCTEDGHHTHDGQDYCGYGHESGYCDGSCGNASTKSTSKHVIGRRRSCH